MATTIQLLRSDISQQRPEPGVLANGTPMVNTYEDDPGLFFAARDGSLFKVGPASVGAFAPNSFPQGQTGNCLGELWVDTSGANPALKFFDGSAFIPAFTSPSALNSHTFTGITPDADATRDLGSPSLRWANIYSADLNLSNEGASNGVDGTWGSYTIQEGEEDLYLINRRSGKRYKFLLQEV